MNVKCIFGFHRWDGCKCSACGKIRDEGHDWSANCERCATCAKWSSNTHTWVGCKCSSCDQIRDKGHEWLWRTESVKCERCGDHFAAPSLAKVLESYLSTFKIGRSAWNASFKGSLKHLCLVLTTNDRYAASELDELFREFVVREGKSWNRSLGNFFDRQSPSSCKILLNIDRSNYDQNISHYTAYFREIWLHRSALEIFECGISERPATLSS